MLTVCIAGISVLVIIIILFQLVYVICGLFEGDIFRTKREVLFWLVPVIAPSLSIIGFIKRMFKNFLRLD